MKIGNTVYINEPEAPYHGSRGVIVEENYAAQENKKRVQFNHPGFVLLKLWFRPSKLSLVPLKERKT